MTTNEQQAAQEQPVEWSLSKGNNILDSAPDEAETEPHSRYRLWSLFDLLPLEMGLFEIAMRDIVASTCFLTANEVEGLGNETGEGLRGRLQAPLEVLRDELKTYRFPYGLAYKPERLLTRLEKGDITLTETRVLLQELHNDILVVFKDRHFLMLDQLDEVINYRQPHPLFGPDVENYFPLATYDISAAGRCLALGEWTACVFHLMRVVEVGLRYFAGELGIEMKEGIDYAEWGAILKRIETTFEQTEQQARGAEKSATQQFYSQVAINIGHFKNAWRNHVMHTREKSDDREAPEVFRYTRSFMQKLAEHEAAKK